MSHKAYTRCPVCNSGKITNYHHGVKGLWHCWICDHTWPSDIMGLPERFDVASPEDYLP